MFCTKCGSKADPDDNFCARCGTSLNRSGETNSASRSDSPPTDLHRLAPAQYVRQITGGGGIPSGERRIVTTLFADLANSTVIGEQLDPEDVTTLMNTAFEAMTESVARYEGTLARLMGDGVLALFGAPVAHEDDAVRACKAGLQIVRSIKALSSRITSEYGISSFEVRVGISCGLTVVGEVGTANRSEYTAMGDSVNLAARLQAAAEPNSVLVDKEVWRQTRNRFEITDLGTMQLKGKSRPISVFRILRPAVSSVIRRLAHSPLVGRESQLGIIGQALKDLGSGSGSVLVINGNAGIGKSRLIEASRPFSPQGVAWIEVQCQAYQSEVGFGVARTLAQSLLGLESETPGETIAPVSREILNARVASIKGGSTDKDSSARRMDAALAYLMHTPLEQDEERMVAERGTTVLMQSVLASCRQLLSEYLRLSPLVLLIEDLHWIDAQSANILEGIASLTKDLPCLLILSTRPGQESLSDPVNRLKNRGDIEVRQVDLEPLATEACEQLIRNLLKGKTIPTDFSTHLCKVSEGNPFFVEEILRSLSEDELIPDENSRPDSTAADILNDIPHSIQAAILSRIDRLDPLPRRIIQTAAVMGRTIAPEALCRVMGNAISPEEMMRCLGDLHQKDFVTTTETSYVSSARGKDALDGKSGMVFGRHSMAVSAGRLGIPSAAVQHYAFNHALTVDIAYNSLLKSERRRLHALVGDALEAVYADRIDELVPTLAWHFERGDNQQKAVEYLVRAGQSALAIYDAKRALRCFSRAQNLSDGLSANLSGQDLSRQLNEGLADAYLVQRNFADSLLCYDRALETTAGSLRSAVLLRKKGRLLLEWNRLDEARVAYESALEAMKDDFDLREAGQIYTGLALVYLQIDRPETALEIGSLALLMSEKSDDRIGVAQARNNLGIILLRGNQLDKAEEHILGSRDILQSTSDTYGQAACEHNLGLLEHQRGNLKLARALLVGAIKVFEDLNCVPALAKSLGALGHVSESLGDEDAVRSCRENVAKLRDRVEEHMGISFPEMWQSGEW